MLARILYLIVTLLLAAACAPAARSQNVTVVGPVTPGNCTMFASVTVIKDAGGTCGGTGVTIGAPISGVCTNGYNLFNNSGVIGCQPGGVSGTLVTTGVCDGVTDDAATIQANINSAITNHQQLIIQGSANGCRIASTLTVNSALSITGLGKANSRIILGTTTLTGFTVTAGNGDILNSTQVDFSNFSIVAPLTNVGGAYVQTGGSGYTNGTQTLTVQGGTCSVQPTVSVTVSGGAVVVGNVLSVVAAGTCTVFPASPANLSDGVHTNATASLFGKSSQTSGAAILIDPGAGKYNNFLHVSNMRFLGMWNGIDGERIGYCTIQESNFDAGLNLDVLLFNGTTPDTASCLLSHNQFTALFPPASNAAHIEVVNIGQTAIIGNRFNGYFFGVFANIASGIATGELTIIGNFFENGSQVSASSPGAIVILGNTGSTFGRVNITGNEISPMPVPGGGTGYGINMGCADAGQQFADVTVSSNTFTGFPGTGTVQAANIDCVTNLNFGSGNTVRNAGATTMNGISFGAKNLNVRYTAPVFAGTLAYQLQNSAPNFAQDAIWIGPGQLPGTATNDNALAGNVGEYASSSIAPPGVNIGSAAPTTFAQVSLGAGDWDVWGTLITNPAAGTSQTIIGCWVYTTTNAFPITAGAVDGQGSYSFAAPLPGVAQPSAVFCGQRRFSLSGTTPVYVICYAAFSGGTNACYGSINARRMR